MNGLDTIGAHRVGDSIGAVRYFSARRTSAPRLFEKKLIASVLLVEEIISRGGLIGAHGCV
jgi:hypothetical protein